MFDPKEQRDLLSLSFEPQGDSFLYYRHRWSRGVPVSVAEREAYLRIPVYGSRRAWRRSIDARPTAPPRPSGPVQRQIVRAIPWSMVMMSGAFGLGATANAWHAPSMVEWISYGIVGLALLLLTAWATVVKISAGRAA